MTFNTNTPELDLKMPELILRAVVANRYVMRELPRLLRQCDVSITHALADVVLEIGWRIFSRPCEKLRPYCSYRRICHPI